MSRERKRWDANLRNNVRRTTIRHRRRWTVIALATLMSLLAAAGLIADIGLHAWRLAYACYAGAAVSGIGLLAFLYNKRLRAVRRPEQ
jgi:hypothetical protein